MAQIAASGRKPTNGGVRINMTFNKALVVGALAVAVLAPSLASAETMINAEVLNFSEQNRWVKVTDMICGNVLYKDRLDAQAKLPVKLCADGSGHAKVKLYIRIGCTKNKTLIKEDIADGATVSF